MEEITNELDIIKKRLYTSYEAGQFYTFKTREEQCFIEQRENGAINRFDPKQFREEFLKVLEELE